MPLRSGLQINPPTHLSSESDESEDSYKPSKTHKRRAAKKFTANQAPRNKKNKQSLQTDVEKQLEDYQGELILPEFETTDNKSSSNQAPNLENYHQLGLEWGLSRAEQILADLDLPKNNRPSASGLFEAQSLQLQYELDKTMLCIVLKCSRRVLNEALLEGPLAREPNMYTNYQTYSVTATKTQMPGKGVSEGFVERNTLVGKTWSSYKKDEQAVFTPQLFEPLCIATSEAYALTQTPLGIAARPQPEDESVTPVSTGTPQYGPHLLTQKELEKYVPIFTRLVNIRKVSLDMHEGRLWRHSGKSRNRSLEQLMMQEISKIVRQLHILKSHFNLHFHLLVACWNPASPNSRALFQDEHTSCERWAKLQQKKHLLECFAFESTKAPEHVRLVRGEAKPPSEAALRQNRLRADLTLSLNELIAPYLRGGKLSKGDAHPKTANIQATFSKKEYRGGIHLTFHRAPDSKVTDMMLEKGPSSLTNNEVQDWIEDIQMKRYTIIRVDRAAQQAKPEYNVDINCEKEEDSHGGKAQDDEETEKDLIAT